MPKLSQFRKGKWVEIGLQGQDGLSAYEIAKNNGFKGSEKKWLNSLVGKDGESIIGRPGKDGANGLSAYEIAKQKGFNGSEKDWLDSLKGRDGLNGTSGGGIKRIIDASDVKITDLSDNQSLTYDAATKKWVNETVSGGSGTVDTIVAGNNIDVDATDPANPIVSVETLTLADISDVTASATEVNYTDGVTSAIQTQLDAKLDDSQATAFGLSLLDDTDASAGRTTLGLVAGGTGDIWVEKAGDAMSGNLAITIPNSGNALGLTVTQNDTTNNPRGASITNTGTGNALLIDQNGAASSSTSVGGAILIENTGNTGAGLVIYSNAGASSGRLMNIRADNVLFDQPAFHIDYDGTTNAFEILHNSTDSSANAISVVSVNQNDSTVGITGQESGKGTIKITHNKPDGVADASAAAISLSLGRVNAGETSAAQGIFLDTTHVTTGKLLNLRNNGTEQAVVSANGVLSLVGTAPAIELGHASDTTLSRVSAGVVAIEGVNILTVAGGTMTGNITLGENTSLALDPAGSADGKYSGITVAGTAGYTQAFGDLVYLDPTDSRWEACDANAAAAADGDARGLIGMVVSAGTDGTACTILLEGIIRADANFPALTIGAPVYVAETAGDIVVAQPTTTDAVIRMVGAALTADEIFFRPDFSYTTHT